MYGFTKIIKNLYNLTNIILSLILSFIYNGIVCSIWYSSHLNKNVITGLWIVGLFVNLILLYSFIRAIRLRQNNKILDYLKYIIIGFVLFLVLVFSLGFGFMVLTNN